MSLVSVISRSLERNSGVGIVSIEIDRKSKYTNLPKDPWKNVVDFYVALIRGIYNAAELQGFMLSLVPSRLTVSEMDYFRESETELSFGRLYFDEMTRRIIISPFPNFAVARDISVKGLEFEYKISKEELEKYRV